jgi:hypothetical protein
MDISMPAMATFYTTAAVNVGGVMSYRNVKWVPTLSGGTSFTLTKDNSFLFGMCTYGYNTGAVGTGSNSGHINQRDTLKPMFSMAVGYASPTKWAGGAACQTGYVYPFAFHQMTLMIGGVSYATKAQSVPPGNAGFIAPENDTYSSPGGEPVHFMNGYARPTGSTNSGWYLVANETTSSAGCSIRLERPFTGTLTMPFFYGASTGVAGFSQFTLSLSAT